MSQSSLLTPRFFGPNFANFASWDLFLGFLESQVARLDEFFDFMKNIFSEKNADRFSTISVFAYNVSCERVYTVFLKTVSEIKLAWKL